MKTRISLVLALVLALGLLSGCGGGEVAQQSVSPASNAEAGGADVDWPNATIYFDVAAKAGGGTDLVTRYLAAGWQEYLDANFVVNNYETSEVGMQHTKNAPPDGYTLTAAACTSMDSYLAGSSEVNPMEDFMCIAKVTGGAPQALFATPDAPYDDLVELKAYIEANPGDLVVGVALGGTSHLFWINLLNSMEVDLDDVVFVQSASEADKLTNVASGAIDLGNGTLSTGIAYEEDNKVKIIGTVSGSDGIGRDDIEIARGLGDQYLTTWEQGFMGASWDAGYYICGPAGMDPTLVETINASLQKLGETKAFVEGMELISTPIDIRNVADSQADFLREWELQRELSTAAGVNIRD